MAPSDARKWEVLAPGFDPGPYDEAVLADTIESGNLLEGRCRPVGETEWRALKAVPSFALALRRAAMTRTMPGRRRPA